MRTRTANPGDYAKLREIHAQSRQAFPLPDLDSPMIEGIEVVVDEQGEIVMAAIAKRVPEIYLLAGTGQLHPVVKMEGIRLLHGALRDTIAGKGYTEFFSFVRSSAFARHLEKWFGWERTWPAYRVTDWKSEVSGA